MTSSDHEPTSQPTPTEIGGIQLDGTKNENPVEHPEIIIDQEPEIDRPD